MVTDSNKLSRQYIVQQAVLAVVVLLCGLLVASQWPREGLVLSAVVGCSFVLVLSVAVGLIWCRLARQSPDSLPTFFTAVSSFRLLLALLVMLVYYLIGGRSTMLTFFLVFMAFYFVSLIHHTVFFARVSNRS